MPPPICSRHSTRRRASTRADRWPPGCLTSLRAHRPARLPVNGETRVPVARMSERPSPADLHQRLLEQYAAPSLVVTEDYQVVHVSDAAAQFLAVPGGEPSRDLLKLLRPELRIDLRAAMSKALSDRSNVTVRSVQLPPEPRGQPCLDQRPPGAAQRRAGAWSPADSVRARRHARGTTRRAGAAAESAWCPGHSARERTGAGAAAAELDYRTVRGPRRRGQGLERRAPGDERGAAFRRRGTRDQQGGTAVGQRGADDRQPGTENQDRGTRPHQQRLPELHQRDGHRRGIPRSCAAHQAVHGPGVRTVQSARERHRPAALAHHQHAAGCAAAGGSRRW